MRSMYEPIHRSAPAIAWQNIANPIASIFSFSIALWYSSELDAEANLLDSREKQILAYGLRTKDIMSSGK